MHNLLHLVISSYPYLLFDVFLFTLLTDSESLSITIMQEHRLLLIPNIITVLCNCGAETLTTTIYFLPALTSVMAQFPDVNPYRWPGWFLAALAATQATAVIFCFTETRTFSCSKGFHNRCSCLAGLKLSAQLKSKWKMQLLVSL